MANFNSRHRNQPVTPRNGHTLVVCIVARISGCTNQKELSLEDQLDHGKQVVADYYDGAVDVRHIATKGKGERLDRPELAEIEAMLRTGEVDLLIVEDIGRLVRGVTAAWLCGIAVDHGTRVIAPNDGIDTAEDSWEEDVISACRDHVGHNAHTSKRLKHKLLNRFVKFGGAMAREIYGYIVPDDATTYADWRKDPNAIPIYNEWFRTLKDTLNCSAVADWLNAHGVPTGPYARRRTWDGKMVRRITRNSLLIGKPGRGHKHTVKHHETGRRVSIPNPEGAQYIECPHLAHVDLDLWEEVNALLDTKNAKLGRKPVNGRDPRLQVPRKRTRFPGQYARCWYCGRHYVWGGNGITDNLQCSGSRLDRCWHSIGFNGPLAVQRLMAAITSEVYNLSGFDDQFRELIMHASTNGGCELAHRRARLALEESTLAHQRENLVAAIAKYGTRPMFQEKLAEIERQERAQAKERRDLERIESHSLQLPNSMTALRQLLEENFTALASESPEFGDVMRLLVPEFYIYAVRLCDGGPLLPRAKVRLDLTGTIPDAEHVPGLVQLATRELTLDLFEPPLRERIRPEVVSLKGQGVLQKQIAARMNVCAKTVERAMALDVAMREQGLADPYVMVMEPPDDYPKQCRHKSSRYTFVPLEGYEHPAL